MLVTEDYNFHDYYLRLKRGQHYFFCGTPYLNINGFYKEKNIFVVLCDKDDYEKEVWLAFDDNDTFLDALNKLNKWAKLLSKKIHTCDEILHFSEYGMPYKEMKKV